MIRPIEKVLIAVTLAGVLALIILIRSPEMAPVAGSTHTTLPSTTVAPDASGPSTTIAVPSTASGEPGISTTSQAVVLIPGTTELIGPAAAAAIGVESTPTTFQDAPATPSSTSLPGTTEAPAETGHPQSTTLPATTEAPAETGPPPATTLPATTQAPTATTTPPTSATTASAAATVTTEAEVPRRCASVEEIWRWDGLSVEDPCTLAEVKRVMRWAWTGTDEQRRSVIRNSHLLDEVFAALDRVGSEFGVGVYHPETRRQLTVLFDNIRWHGGPEFDRAVVAVDYNFYHPDYGTGGSWRTVTLVQVDGDWKLSYRRSYCRMTTVTLEYYGSDVRCPPDPHPEVNEDEFPDAIREH